MFPVLRSLCAHELTVVVCAMQIAELEDERQLLREEAAAKDALLSEKDAGLKDVRDL